MGVWQTTIRLKEYAKGCHLITDEILRAVQPGLASAGNAGLLHLFVQHTSCALTINENYDPDVRKDMDMALNTIVPDTLPWRHTDEGPDDSSSHTKSALMGASVTIPITANRLNLGTWQGIYLVESRKDKHVRSIVATILS